MAKPKIQDIPPVNDDESQSGETLEEQVERREYEIENVDRDHIDKILLSQDVQKGGKIRVERRGPLDRDFQYITTMPAESWDAEATMEHMKKMYGGGDYKCMTFRANGQLYKPFTFSIDHRVKGKLDEDEIARLANQQRTGDGVAMKLLADIQTQNKPDPGAIRPMDLIKVMETGSKKSDDMMALVMTMMMKSQETMATILAAALSRPSQVAEKASIDPVLIELLRAKQDRPPMMEVLEIMRAVKDLNSEEPKEQTEESMFDKILKAAQLIMPALQAGQQPAVQVGAGTPPDNGPSQPPPPPPSPLPPGLIASFPPAIQIAIRQLVHAAEKGSDPELYADLIIDQIEDPRHWMFLRTILTDDGWKAKLFGDENRVAHIAPWLEELRSVLLRYDPNSPDASEAGNSNPVSTQRTGAGLDPDTQVPGVSPV